MPVDSLTSKVKDRLTNRTNKRVYVKADARTHYGNVVQVVDAVRAAGVDDLGLLTDQRKSTAAPPAAPASRAMMQVKYQENDHEYGIGKRRRAKRQH